MRTTMVALVLALASISAQTPPVTPATRDSQATMAPAGTASLAGTVVITIDGRPSPVRRARVVVQAEGGAPRTTDTDTAGHFRVAGLVAGAYRVMIDKPGFVPIGHVPRIDVRDGQSVTATITMQRGAAIEGRLIGEDGEPVMGLTVSAVQLGYGPYGKTVVAERQTTTDDLGRFRVHTLSPGEYYIEAAPDALRAAGARPSPAGTPKPARTYYPGTARLNEASAIAVNAGDEFSGADVKIVSAVMSVVRGRVTTSSGQPPASFSMRVQRVGAPPGEVRCFIGSGEPGDNGFQCSAVPPGDFWLLAAARAAPNAPVEFGMTRVTVEGRDLLSLVIATAPGIPVRGRVEVDGGGQVPGAVRIAALETEYEFPASVAGTGATSATAPVALATDGGFTFASLAGPRLLRADRLPAGWAVKGVWLHDAEISDTPTVFAATEKPPVVRVVLAPRTGSVAGIVSNLANQPAAGSRVVVFSEDSHRWGARSRFIKTAETDGAGRYTIDGLLPGNYRVAFVDALADGAWEDPDVLGRLLPSAAAITIAGTERLTVDGKVKW
jgi:hypothetical protein